MWRVGVDSTRIGFAVAALAFSGQSAAALDFCITCTAPDAHYLCRMDTPSANARDLRLQLLCISQLAEIGSHATCSIDNPRPQTCNGVLRVVEAPQDITAPPAAVAQPAPAPAEPAKAATETVITKEVSEPTTPAPASNPAPAKTGGVMEQTGSAISQAAKKTWKCLSTLFGDC